MSQKARGLPIAVHLSAMVGLAVSAAFVAALAIVVLLPPRPPEVMRADQLARHFAAAYQAATAGQTLLNSAAATFRVTPTRPHGHADDDIGPVEMMLASTLDLAPDKVFVQAREERRDTYVFRVQRAEGRIEMRTEHGQRVTRVITSDPRTGEIRTIDINKDDTPDFPDPVEPSTQTDTVVETVEGPEPHQMPGGPDGFGEGPIAPPSPPSPPQPPSPPLFAPPPQGVMLLSGFTVGAQLANGQWLVMTQARNQERDWIITAAAAFAATLAVLGVLAWLYAQRLARPIQGFSLAVQGVGVDPHHASVAVSGPRELQDAADAINAMQSRLRALVADRTKTLATVAHDMRTPLMRMRLAAESGPSDLREKLSKEISDVEALVASFIAFARDDPAEEPRARLDMAALLESLVEDHVALGRKAEYIGPDRLILTGQPLGLQRVFANLIDNAIKYAGSVRVRLSEDDFSTIVDVEDDGPGVPDILHADIFKPFVRASQESSGAGLGLASARGIVRAHGGDIILVAKERGALFRTRLPR